MRKSLLLLSFIIVLTACSSSDSGSTTGGDDTFNRTALLTHWADNIIIPAYENYDAKVGLMAVEATSFTTEPTTENLATLRISWLEAYKAFQKVTIYNVGKSVEVSFKEAANSYPADASGIQQNITSGNYNLDLFSQFPKQGFPGLDYMLNGLGSTDAEIVGFYATNANAAAFKQYLLDVVAALKTKSNAVSTDWTNGYRATFKASNGTAVSSSTNKITNLFVKNLEKDIRTFKIGIPAGILSNGAKFPEKVEGFYAKNVSKTLLNTAIQAQQDFFNGKAFNGATTGPSLKSYLDDVKAIRGGLNLSDIINTQFTTIYSLTATLDDNFVQEISTNTPKMIEAYDAIQQNVIYLKLDMMQALNITIDYVDGDGD